MNGCKYLQSSVHIFLASFAIASLRSLVYDGFFLDVSNFHHMLASIPEGPAAPFVSVSEALFCLCCGTNIYNSFWGVPEFQDTYHGFLYFLTFLSFS